MSELIKQSSSAPFFLEKIAKKEIDPKSLTTHQRRVCVRFLLMEGKHAQYEIAAILKCDPAVITRDKRRIQHQNSWMLDELDERRIAVNLIQVAEIASARLFRQNKSHEAWKVQRELMESLQSLGYVKKKPVEFEGKVSLQEILKLATNPNWETEFIRADNGHPAAN